MRTYEEWNQRRTDHRGKLEVELDRPLEFSVTHSLRLEWVAAQARDPVCYRIHRRVGARTTSTGARGDSSRRVSTRSSGERRTDCSRESPLRRTLASRSGYQSSPQDRLAVTLLGGDGSSCIAMWECSEVIETPRRLLRASDGFAGGKA